MWQWEATPDVKAEETDADSVYKEVSYGDVQTEIGEESSVQTEAGKTYTVDTKISDVINDPVFGDYGRLIFPVDTGFYSGETLGELRLTWYSNISPDKTVEITNYMRDHAEAGDVIFYDIYTDEEKQSDPDKEDTGLFFFKGNPGEKFAVCNVGGGFAYVGAMQDSFPHALELSKKGYNAFALIYRPGAQTACEDLARAISFIFAHAEDGKSDNEIALAGIEMLENFILEIGLPVTLRELGVDEQTDLKKIADSCTVSSGSYKEVSHEEILEIFKECL